MAIPRRMDWERDPVSVSDIPSLKVVNDQAFGVVVVVAAVVVVVVVVDWRMGW